MSVANALTVFVDTAKYAARVAAIDVKLKNLNDLKDEYRQLLNDLKDQVTGEDSAIFESMRMQAMSQVELLDSEIKTAQATRNMLQKTIDEMEDNVSSVQNIIQDSISSVQNVVQSTANTAEAAAEAAIIAAIL